MNWRFIKAFPKYAIVLGVLVLSTGLFAAWWWFKYSKPRWGFAPPDPKVVEAIRQKAASLPEKLGWLALVGTDLYDISSGELIFKNWIGGIPQRLFYHPDSNRLMVQVERGIMRFGLDGKQDGVMGVDSPPAFTHDGKLAIYVKNGDVWVADVDWTNFRFANERQATKYGQFNAPFFAANVILGSEKACVVRHQNKLLRVDLLNGDLQPMRVPISVPGKRRSPDGQMVFGADGDEFFVYDVGEVAVRTFPKGRDNAADFQWLSNDACAVVLAGKRVSVYDRKKNTISEVATLPFPCNTIAGPSPDGRYVLCASRQGIAAIDVVEKRAENLGTAAQTYGWVSDDTLLYSRDVPDMSTRGTWLRTMGNPERQVMGEPYVFGRDGIAAVALMRELNLVVFATKDALFRMKPDGSELREVAKLARPAARIQAVEIWGK